MYRRREGSVGGKVGGATQLQRSPGKRALTDSLSAPVGRGQTESDVAADAASAGTDRSTETGLDGVAPDAPDTAPPLTGSDELPPAEVMWPHHYPGVAELVGTDEALGEVPPPPQVGGAGKPDKDGGAKKDPETGIASQVSMGRFITAAHEVEKSWGGLAKEARADKLGAAANAELTQAGVPKVGIVVKDMPDRNGQLDFKPWNLDLSKQRFEPATTTTDVMASVASEVYHESRHAEQWFRMARLEAGKGKKGKAIASALGIKREVADAAEGTPLSGASQEAKEAEAWHTSVYSDEGAKYRRMTLKNLSTSVKALSEAARKHEAAGAVYAKAAAEKGAGAPETKAALTAWQATYAAYQTVKTSFDIVYAAYKALPEEADAWKLGDRVQAAYKGK